MAGGATPADNPASKNPSLQCLRGLAALFVALFHASGYAEARFGDAGWTAIFGGAFGVAGVAIFFAISGLLMAELIQRTDPWRFLAHRVVRIYPPYFIAVLVSVPIIGLLGIRKFGPHIFSLMLVPAGPRTYYLGIEWTLVFECTYYVALFLVALAGWQRYLNRIALAWIGVMGAAALFTGWTGDVFFRAHSIWLAAANVAFAGGLLVPWIAGKVRIPVGTGVLALCVFLAAMPGDLLTARWTAGAVAVLLVLDAIRIKASRRATLGLPVLGDWSYALYLAHVPCFVVVYHFWPTSAGIGAGWLCAIAVALAVSAGFGMLDVWLYRRLKHAVDALGKQDRRRRVALYAGAFVIASLLGAVMT